ncbi:MAG: 50S ribosomal protein L7 [Oscillibacter sp.]|nr:50S ribosomal protein L7 [Oscillibacter sp.]
MNNFLSLLGLALRGNRLVAGEEPVTLAAEGGKARLILASSDASGNTLRRVEHLAEAGHCLWLIIPFTKSELGGALGRATVAMAAVTDLGLASAAVSRLALMDPERYGDAAARMDLKVRRAAERKDAPSRGKVNTKKPPRRPPPAKGGPGSPGGQRRKGPPGSPEARRQRSGSGGSSPPRRDGPPPRSRAHVPSKGRRGPGKPNGPNGHSGPGGRSRGPGRGR